MSWQPSTATWSAAGDSCKPVTKEVGTSYPRYLDYLTQRTFSILVRRQQSLLRRQEEGGKRLGGNHHCPALCPFSFLFLQTIPPANMKIFPLFTNNIYTKPSNHMANTDHDELFNALNALENNIGEDYAAPLCRSIRAWFESVAMTQNQRNDFVLHLKNVFFNDSKLQISSHSITRRSRTIQPHDTAFLRSSTELGLARAASFSRCLH